MIGDQLRQKISEDPVYGDEKSLQNEDRAPNGGNDEQACQKVAF